MTPLPVHIISGFLGAGKTTAILRLLGRKPVDENWAILINEFGKISIDGQTIRSKSSQGTVFEITGGCICCSAQAYFAENLDRIISENRYDRIVIEPSGLGGIDHIRELAGQNANLQLMPVVCIVDITMTALPRIKMLPIFKNQIEKADLILFSKTELADDRMLKELTDQFCLDFPFKNYALQSVVDELFENSNQSRLPVQGTSTHGYSFLADSQKAIYREICLKFSGSKVVNPEILRELLRNEPAIVRAKGYIYTGEEWVLFNYTLSGYSLEIFSQRAENELVLILGAEMKEPGHLKDWVENL